MRLCAKDDCPVPATFCCWTCAKPMCLHHAFRLLDHVYCYDHFVSAINEIDFDIMSKKG